LIALADERSATSASTSLPDEALMTTAIVSPQSPALPTTED